MKRFNYTLIFLILFAFQSTFGQIYNFQTSSVTLSLLSPKGKWSKWSQPKETNIIIKLDTKKSRIIIYSEVIQVYEIIEYVNEKSDKKNDTVSFVCKDNEGEDCNISIITRKNQDNRMQLYITAEERIINYNISLYKN